MRAFPSHPVVSVGAVVVDCDRVLLVKRGHPPLKGQWSLPGGVVEIGETLHAALVREVKEETGLDVEVGPVVEVLDRIERSPDGRVEYHYVIVDYVCSPRAGTLVCGSDADEARWVDAATLPQYQPPSAVRAVVSKALALARQDL